MKAFIVFALIAIVSAVNAADTKEQDEIVRGHLKDCRAKFEMTDEKFAELKAGKISEGSETERCFVDCFFEKSEILNDGKLQQDIALKKIAIRVGEEQAKKALETCGKESGLGKCETALKLHNCLHKIGVY